MLSAKWSFPAFPSPHVSSFDGRALSFLSLSLSFSLSLSLSLSLSRSHPLFLSFSLICSSLLLFMKHIFVLNKPENHSGKELKVISLQLHLLTVCLPKGPWQTKTGSINTSINVIGQRDWLKWAVIGCQSWVWLSDKGCHTFWLGGGVCECMKNMLNWSLSSQFFANFSGR